MYGSCFSRFELNIKHPWWHSQSLCLSPSNLPIALLLQGGSQAKEYVGYIPDIFPNDSENICLVYPWHIPDIRPSDSENICLVYPWHIPDIRPNDSEKICQTYFEIYLVYDTVCHIPGISRNMYDILHNCSYPRYIPRISNFYRFQTRMFSTQAGGISNIMALSFAYWAGVSICWVQERWWEKLIKEMADTKGDCGERIRGKPGA